jgi:hypothetical protein
MQRPSHRAAWWWLIGLVAGLIVALGTVALIWWARS